MSSFLLVNERSGNLTVAVEPWAQIIDLKAKERATFEYAEPATVDITLEEDGTIIIGISSERLNISTPYAEIKF